MKTAFFVLILAAAALWSVQRIAAARLAVELEARREEQRELAAAQREHQRLGALQPGADELAALRAAGADHARLRAALARREESRAAPRPPLPLGEWTPASEWRNCGQATARAAVETTLWAAAGGDVAALQRLLLFAEPVREQAAALLARLPAAARAHYHSAEQLVAEFTVRNIPLGQAQLVWFNQSSADDAAACVFLQAPPSGDIAPAAEPAVVAAVNPRIEELQAALGRATTREEAVNLAKRIKAERAADPGREPPRARDNSRRGQAFLTLHREAEAWRLVVPSSAVEAIARELALPPVP